MNRSELLKSFYSAAGLLSESLWSALGGLEEDVRLSCEEIRLRIDRPMELRCGCRSVFPAPTRVVRAADLEETLRRCTGDSVHTYLPQLCQGFATARGGHRFGICGEGVYSGGMLTGIRGVSSLNIRIARPICGVADPLVTRIAAGEPQSLLVVSEPGGGKTTFLRDLARGLSRFWPVAICDTRYELAGVTEGRPRFQIGSCDVLSGVDPARGLEMLTRTMSPRYLVTDEITGSAELAALEQAAFAGVALLASCHSSCARELDRRGIYRQLLHSGLFSRILEIENREGCRHYRLYEEVPDVQADGWGTGDAFCLAGHCYRATASF